jgi:hypothetical protein
VAALTPRWVPAITAGRPVFLGASGRCWRWLRRGAQLTGAALAGLPAFVAALAVAGPEPRSSGRLVGSGPGSGNGTRRS